MTNRLLPWDNGSYSVDVTFNPSEENAKSSPKVYVVTNIETGIQEMFTMQLPQAFVYAVQSKSTIKQAQEMEKPSNVIPLKRTPKEPTPENGGGKTAAIKLN